MKITVDVNINAPGLTAAIITLSSALRTVTSPSPVMRTAELVQDCCKFKSEFRFPLKEAVAEPEKEDPKPEPTPEPEPEPTPTPEPAPEPEEAPEPAPTVTREQVRARLTALSQDGKQAQVKELITSFGAKKLTDIPADKFADVLAAAGEL
ncbi:MAG: hypothetical protein AB1815_02725 [Bacillota bacterium]